MDSGLSYYQEMGFDMKGHTNCLNPECEKPLLVIFHPESNSMYADIVEIDEIENFVAYKQDGKTFVKLNKPNIS